MTVVEDLIVVEVVILVGAAFWFSKLPPLPKTVALRDSLWENALALLLIAVLLAGGLLTAGSYPIRYSPAMFPPEVRVLGLGPMDLGLIGMLCQRLVFDRQHGAD